MSVSVLGDVAVALRGETGARAPEVWILFTVSLVDLSVADVLTFEIGDFVRVDGFSEAGRALAVNVEELAGFVGTLR